MTEYQTTRQKNSEYLDDWANRSVGLAYRAFHDLPEARVEQLAITRLCQGCNDKDAGKYPLPAILHYKYFFPILISCVLLKLISILVYPIQS